MSDRGLTPELLLGAYAAGVFPMAEAEDDPDVFWVDPQQRGILPLDGFHISRSLARRMRRGGVRATLDRDFEAVLDGCAEQTETRPDTWINPEIRRLYLQLADIGYCHSVEVWDGTWINMGWPGVEDAPWD